MKKAIIALAATAALLASACCTTTAKKTTDDQRDYVSWIAFCAARGYQADDTTIEAFDEYLDTWCGSTEEEQAFIKAGIDLE